MELQISSTYFPDNYDPFDPKKERAWMDFITETLENLFYANHPSVSRGDIDRNRLRIASGNHSVKGK
jgi:hypothetical protein